MNQLIEKTFKAIIKDVDVKKGIVEGYFNTWDIVDSDGDELIRGAFAKSILERGPGSASPRIFHLLQHNSRQPLYRFKDADSIKEDDTGLFFRSVVSKTTYGRDTLLLYNDEVINEHSIGFQIIKEEAGEDHNKILEVKLWEGSTVTWGANANTPVTDLKSLDLKEIAEKFNDRINLLTKSIRDGSYSDDTFVLLELQLKQVQAHYQSLIDAQPAAATEKDKPKKKVTVQLSI